MIKKIDAHLISLLLGVLFLLGLGATAFSIYSLESTNTQSVWIFLITTSLLGAAALVLALRNVKEIIVFKDKASSINLSDTTTTNDASNNTIELTSLRNLVQRGHRDVVLEGVKLICKQLEAGQGAVYNLKEEEEKRWMQLTGGYALSIGENTIIKFDIGEGLIGQCAANGHMLYIDEVPEGYMKVVSGLGMASPRYLLISPIKKEDKVVGVIEISSFKSLSEAQRKFVEEACLLLGTKA